MPFAMEHFVKRLKIYCPKQKGKLRALLGIPLAYLSTVNDEDPSREEYPVGSRDRLQEVIANTKPTENQTQFLINTARKRRHFDASPESGRRGALHVAGQHGRLVLPVGVE